MLYCTQKDKTGSLASRNSQTCKNDVCNLRTKRLEGSLRVVTVSSVLSINKSAPPGPGNSLALRSTVAAQMSGSPDLQAEIREPHTGKREPCARSKDRLKPAGAGGYLSVCKNKASFNTDVNPNSI